MSKNSRLSALLLLLSLVGFAQENTVLQGKLVGKDSGKVQVFIPIYINDTITSWSSSQGSFEVKLPKNTTSLIFRVAQDSTYTVTLKPNEINEQTFVTKDFELPVAEQMCRLGQEPMRGVQIPQVLILRSLQSFKEDESTQSLLDMVPIIKNSFNLETVLTTLPGVNSNNELSNQYMVRGGNFDENLIYVNGVEVYRPTLVRSGKQEGLSFINPSMVSNIAFSAGGFSSLYGDKLSSALAIDYRNPIENKTQLKASFLGASATVDLVSKDKSWSGIAGIRYQNNRLLMNRKDDDSYYKPVFMDMQTVVNYNATDQLSFNFLGSIAGNSYKYEPKNRHVTIGTINELSDINILYNGWEQDKYSSVFGALSSKYRLNYENRFEVIVSAYHSQEKEFFDMETSYLLKDNEQQEDDPLFNDVIQQPIGTKNGVVSQLSHARNILDALYITAEVKGIHKIGISNREATFSWGLKYANENSKDRLSEWQLTDSLGYVLPNNHQYGVVSTKNNLIINRLMTYVNWEDWFEGNNVEYFINIGGRAHYWAISEANKSNIVFSPRAQLSIKPMYWANDMKFTFSTGFYQQPPTYREYRDFSGEINPNLKAQKALIFVLGNQYNFEMWNKKFSLRSEAYYKRMSNVNIYNVDNVRIRYVANNDAKAYAYGLDVRLFGQFIEGTESWVSFGYMKTEENYQNQGYIARPTDQRLKFGMFFEDYIVNMPNLKLYLNLVYNTGLPGGGPAYASSYDYTGRLRDYKRADLGFNYILKNKQVGTNVNWLQGIDNLQIGFEIYNLFNNQNAITNSWVKDLNNGVDYAVPNYMTERTYNLKIAISF